MNTPISIAPRLAFVRLPRLLPMALAGIFFAIPSLRAVTPADGADESLPKSAKAQETEARYGALPLSFEKNVGQVPSRFDSVARGAGYSVYVSNQEMLIALRPSVAGARVPARGSENTQRKKQRGEDSATTSTLLQFTLKGANVQAEKQFTAPLPGRVNYLQGNEPQAWHSDVPIYAKLGYHSIYPGVDMMYHGDQRQMEHDFIIAPGTDPKIVEWILTGHDKIEIDSKGSLLLQTGAGMLRLPKAIAYQDLPSGRQAVAVDYELRGTCNVGFKLGTYDSHLPLVIDPVLYYSTFLGGNDYDEAYGIAVDSSGNAYVTGVTYSTNFPLAGAIKSVNGALGDAFVAKINPAGTALVYCTYLGGNGYEEGSSVAVDGTGAAYVAGVTFSTNFPVANAVQSVNAGNGDAFMAKLSASGSSLVFSTYLGGAGYDSANAVAVNNSGISCMAGTYEDPATNDSNGFAAKFNAAGTALTYDDKVGGSGADSIYGIAIDSAGNVYLAGETASRDFPTTAGAFDTSYNGAGDAFVSKLDPAGANYVYSTFLGGLMADKAYAIAIDTAGNAYVTGETLSNNFPVAQAYQPSILTGGDAFVTKLNPTGTALVYSSYLGGGNLDFGTGIAVDSTNSAHVTGYTSSLNFPLVRALQSVNGGGGDAFVARFFPAGNTIIYSTFIGGAATDYANAIAVDSSQVSYIAGYTVSSDYPRYLPLQNIYGGVADAFVTKIGNPVVTITASDANASEPGTNTGQFTVTRTGNPAKQLVVYLTISGTATNGTDYTTIPASVTIPANSVSAMIQISPIDDQVWEGDETVVLTISSNVSYTVGNPKTATVTIVDNEIKPTVTIQATDATAAEPGTDTGTFRVTRNTSTVGPLTVSFTVSGTATKGADYVALPASVVIPAGSSTADITVTPVDDAIYEGPETVVATLTTSALYSLGTPSTATVTINDNEIAPIVSVQAFDSTASEPGTDTGTFRITRTGSTTQPLTVSYAISGTATSGVDYNAPSGTVSIPAGSTTADVVITPIDDTLGEATETVILTVSISTHYAVGSPNNATVNILDNDGGIAQTVTLQATDSTASEAGPQTGQFTVTRTGSTTSSLAVSFTVTGTATTGLDYNGLGGSVTIPAGSASATVTVTPIDDLLIEGSETVIATLAPDAAYTIGTQKTGTVTIADDDTVKPTVTVVATDASAAEAGLDPGTFTFTRNGGSLNVALSVSYTVGGTATAGTDYSFIGGYITIPAGSTSATATVTPIDDLLVEGAETIIVSLSADPVYTVGSPNTATISIADNDSAQTIPVVTVVASDPNASEPGADTGSFTFSRSGSDTSVALSVYYTMSGTANQYSDYSGPYSSTTIPVGSLSTTVTLTPYDDLIIEGPETAILTLNADPAYTVGSPNTATVTIADNDTTKPVVSVVASDASASEAGTNTGTFTFTRTGGDISVALGVTFAVGGTATEFSDYGGVYGSVTIPAGSTTVAAVLTPYDDLIIEGPETCVVTLSTDPNNLYTVGTLDTATITIADDDTVKPVVKVSATDSSASEAGTNTGTFTFTRTGGSLNVSLSVTFAVGGTATEYSDYGGVYGSVTIPAGSTTVDAVLTPYDDLIIEGPETCVVTLSPDPYNIYTVGTPNTATITIADDDTVKPTVTVVATDANAAEPGTTINNGTFTFTRSGGNTNVALYVSYAISGTATYGYDYSGVYGSVTIPAGSTTATDDVVPYADHVTEGNETVIVTVSPDTYYNIYNVGSPSTATVTISDSP